MNSLTRSRQRSSPRLPPTVSGVEVGLSEAPARPVSYSKKDLQRDAREGSSDALRVLALSTASIRAGEKLGSKAALAASRAFCDLLAPHIGLEEATCAARQVFGTTPDGFTIQEAAARLGIQERRLQRMREAAPYLLFEAGEFLVQEDPRDAVGAMAIVTKEMFSEPPLIRIRIESPEIFWNFPTDPRPPCSAVLERLKLEDKKSDQTR